MIERSYHLKLITEQSQITFLAIFFLADTKQIFPFFYLKMDFSIFVNQQLNLFAIDFNRANILIFLWMSFKFNNFFIETIDLF